MTYRGRIKNGMVELEAPAALPDGTEVEVHPVGTHELLERKEFARDTALENLRGKIAVGLDQIKKGQVHDGEKVFKELQERSRKHRGGAA